jgi:PAS domain S-box-containing protein
MNPFNWTGRLVWGLGAVWTALVAASLLWNLHQARQTALELASTQAQLSYNKDLVYRLWAAGHGGVYVPITLETPPNPYLSHIPERDIRTPSGRALTLMNPAYMTRQVHELAAQLYGIKGHLTSLKPIRPENAPDPWEAKALKAFEAGTPEILKVVELAGEPHLRFMRPMHTEKACLKCHAAQGYKEGDIRGGISVDVSLKPFLVGLRSQTFPLAAGHGLIWVLGLAGIIMGNQRIWHYLGECQQAEEALRRTHDELEERIEERTASLRLANEQLLWEIEERQQVEDRLRESEARFTAFMKHLPGLAVMRDMQGRYIFANHAWEEVMGFEPGAWHGKTPAELWPSEKAANLQKLDYEIIAAGKTLEQMETMEQVDGTHYILSNLFPMLDKDGLPYMVGGIGIDITDRKKAEEALKESEIRLRHLAEQLLTAQESERKRLAAEVHDELGHALLTLKLHLSSLEKKMLPEQEDLKEEIRSQLDYIQEVIQEVRRLYHDLSPGDLEDLGLTKALRALINDFAVHVPQITWQVNLMDLEGLFSLPVQTTIYRILQEALTNIGKHAHPTLVIISSQKEDDRVHFVIQDNGKGFNVQELGTQATGRGLGLVAMEERLKMLGGSLEIQSRDQEGTRLSFKIPTLQKGIRP